MKPAPFEYVAPASLAEALAIMAEHGSEAKLLAGGQSLVPVMNFRLAQPTLIVDLNRLAGLDAVEKVEGALQLGAMVRQRRLEFDGVVAEWAALLQEVVPYVAHPQIRNRGTLGGSLVHADPAAELPVVAVLLNGRFHLQRQSSSRWVQATDFFTGLFSTALAPDEILTHVALPILPPRTGTAFLELARRHGDYAQAGVAVTVRLDEAGLCEEARLVYLNVGEVPMVAAKAALALQGHPLTDEAVLAAAELATREEIEPTTDVHATADYKRHLAKVLTIRAINQAKARVTA